MQQKIVIEKYRKVKNNLKLLKLIKTNKILIQTNNRSKIIKNVEKKKMYFQADMNPKSMVQDASEPTTLH
jgi:hypothetical protein